MSVYVGFHKLMRFNFVSFSLTRCVLVGWGFSSLIESPPPIIILYWCGCGNLGEMPLLFGNKICFDIPQGWKNLFLPSRAFHPNCLEPAEHWKGEGVKGKLREYMGPKKKTTKGKTKIKKIYHFWIPIGVLLSLRKSSSCKAAPQRPPP